MDADGIIIFNIVFIKTFFSESGNISANELMIVFPDSRKEKTAKKERYAISDEMEDEIKKLFKTVDKDNNNFIDKSEFRTVFLELRVTSLSPKEVDALFD